MDAEDIDASVAASAAVAALDAFDSLLVVNNSHMDGDVVRRKENNAKLGRIQDRFGGERSCVGLAVGMRMHIGPASGCSVGAQEECWNETSPVEVAAITSGLSVLMILLSTMGSMHRSCAALIRRGGTILRVACRHFLNSRTHANMIYDVPVYNRVCDLTFREIRQLSLPHFCS